MPQDKSARELALQIYLRALDCVRADRLVRDAMKLEGGTLTMGEIRLELTDFQRIVVLGAGKASVGMAQAVEGILGDCLTEGVVVTKHGHGGPTKHIRVLEAGHPVPDEGSLSAGRAIYEMAQRAGEKDLVIFLISGGASALMELPADGVSREDLQTVTSLILRSGAPIEEMNCIRACLSRLKAGGLARTASPARVVCLVLSDVLGNPLSVIGSGPCVETLVRTDLALEILTRRNLLDMLPDGVVQALHNENGAKQIQKVRVDHVLVGDIWTALNAAKNEARRLGLHPLVLTGWIQGEAREVAKVFAGIAKDLPSLARESGVDCVIAGGETTVTVTGDGLGGRSQEIAVQASALLDGMKNTVLLAAGTDGTDGPTDAGGGIADGGTMRRAMAAGFSPSDALRNNDAYPYLASAGDLIKTGPTRSNVGDLIIMVGGEQLPSKV